MRYHLLRASGTIRKVGVCLVLLAVSYLAAALANASPVTQPALVGPYSRGRVIVITPAQPTEPAAFPSDLPTAHPEPPQAPVAPARQRL